MSRRQNFIDNWTLLTLAMTLALSGRIADGQVDDARIVYPDGYRDSTGLGSTIGGNTTLEMELTLAREFNEIQTLEDFLNKIQGVPEGENLGVPSLSNRFNVGDERANVEIPKQATCTPKEQPVLLKRSTINTKYFPSCTWVPRCSGCCGHPEFSCQPTETVARNFQVIAVEYDIQKHMRYKSKETVVIEEHTKCRCGCTRKAKDCNEKQSYIAAECRCECTNTDEESKCLKESAIRRWNPETCTCACLGIYECTNGMYYDHNICSCRRFLLRNHNDDNGQQNRRTYPRYDLPDSSAVGQSPVIYTIDANDPRRRHKEDPE
ncbi:platelet-derived growth factor subunit A-like isoform X1 [Neodiprion virginianus]|uniref:platelet-derived growth factor subunit A-like isoform X1 n=1 Tax=Neodiprion virginianus TaxID=2961670 RepID=UPI001EE69838|nr:platelet-derived growth factor subunit A-like isoform X1 [Neodiprion virginianus]XP_046615771.1 platelet-derived growth factor subunit A-like isoform X1 [Neodiprion virginianus]